MATDQLRAQAGISQGHVPQVSGLSLAKIKTVEYFRVKRRWLFVKVTDDQGGYGWGEATLEGHTKVVEGLLDEIVDRIVGYEAE
ncbi:galactonate dehydratase [Capronia coronata CBS 617.96]|uniref:Galactonate dehydratase n=1 Tax=Capronia coronata CBS 617.96 TaxID=1182541 RepID=W9YRZ6_9EURO|nr:galactonate dehydratase [Capronia coronata CBS 617.96]EXJ95677.1 galactonate dehydratase [Capronia coronata CBS 617.96]